MKGPFSPKIFHYNFQIIMLAGGTNLIVSFIVGDP